MATSSTSVVIRRTARSGLGVFASQRIQAGDRILAEAPLFAQHLIILVAPGGSNDTGTAADSDAALDAFLDLTIEDQDEYLRLSYPTSEADKLQLTPLFKTEVSEFDTITSFDQSETVHSATSLLDRVAEIFNNNAFEIGKRADDGTVAANIFLTASRINHSCIPNAGHAWNEQLQQKTVHALRDIEAGEEVTISYVSTLYSTPTRKRWLGEGYGFECTCIACDTSTPTGMFISGRRARMQELHESLMSPCDPSQSTLQQIVQCRDLLVLTDKEQMNLWECRGRIYHMLSGLYALMGDPNMAVDWLEAAAENAVLNFGGDDALFIEILHELEMLKQKLPRMLPLLVKS